MPPLVEPVAALSDAERLRTARHASLVGFGELGQRRLAAAHVAVVGAGGLGSPAVLALAAAGVGTLTIIDDDLVEVTNLQRQIMHRHADVGVAKIDSAVRVVRDLSPATTVHARRERLTSDNAIRLFAGAHLIIDGTDTFDTRGAVAAATESLGIPLVWGVVQEFHAQVTVFWSSPPPGTEAIRLSDLYPPESVGEVPTCAEVGVLGALCLQVGGLLATEAIKLIAGIGEPLIGRVAVIDSLRARQSEVSLHPRPATTPIAAAPPAAAPDLIVHLTPAQALAAQDSGAIVLDVREPSETATGVIAGSVLVPLATLLEDVTAAGVGPFVVVCHRGSRARRAATAFAAQGISASVLEGGIAGWDLDVVPA